MALTTLEQYMADAPERDKERSENGLRCHDCGTSLSGVPKDPNGGEVRYISGDVQDKGSQGITQGVGEKVAHLKI